MAGTVLALGLLALSSVAGPLPAALAPVVGYGFAWTAHFLVEGNRPATFGHPLWSLLGDLRMAFLFLSGRLDDELGRHHIPLGDH